MVYSVRMRRLSERARLEGMLALRKALDGVRRGPGAALAAGDEFVRASLFERNTDAAAWWRRAELDPEEGAGTAPVDEEFVSADRAPLTYERDAELLKG